MTTVVPERRTKVLVVDGDAAFRRSTALTLERNGYICLEAVSGTEAHEILLADDDVAAVLCDITNPGGSGVDLLSDVTADFPDVAAVATTGVDTAAAADASFRLGAFGYLVKPFGTNELLNNLAGALRRRDLEQEHRRAVRALEQTIARTRTLGGLLETLEGASDAPLQEEEVMARLSRAVSMRDEETGRHIERMSRYAMVIAKAVGFTERSLEDLRLATALHDVGKIGIADGILLKPGPLSVEEHTAMQRHSLIGFQFLADSTSELLRAAADIALSHHEWWDGGGYPRGLHGEEIPEEARIAAVADVFDALTSNRVYRPGLTFDEALAIMADLRGRQFEPRLLDAFVSSMDEVAAIRRAFPDLEDEPGRIRILVVDDQEIFAHSLVRLLGSRPEFKIVGSAGRVADAVAGAVAYEPDVILMDFELPDGDGAQATEQVKALTPAAKVIMLTVRDDEQVLVRSIAAGCSGFVKKDAPVEDLLAAIVAVHEGETITPQVELVPLLRQLRPTRRGLGADLTPRELDVLRLMASGLVNKEIAQHLGVRLNTVRNHVQNVSYKLHAHSKLEAVATAVREGVLDYPTEVE